MPAIASAARAFNGTTDKVIIPPAGIATASNLIPGTVDSGVRRSHPLPFLLANSDILLTYTTNEFGARFSMAICRSTDGGVTFGTAAEVGGSGGGAVDTFEGCFAQLSGGTVVFFYGEGLVTKYKTSADNGATWSSATTVNTGTNLDPHPSCALDGSTLVVTYVDNGTIYVRRATVTSTTVGAFGSAITVIASGTRSCLDPCIVCTSAGDLIVSYLDSATGLIYCKRSTDSGATWGSEITPGTGMGAVTNADPNLVIYGGVLWLIYVLGVSNTGTYPSVTPGNRHVVAMTSADAGATWRTRRVLFQDYRYDMHRVNACVNASGDLIAYGSSFFGDTDYHIDRIIIDQDKADTIAAAGQTATADNMTTWTAFAWVKYAGTANAAGNMFLLSKGGLASSLVNRAYLQFRDDGTYTNGLLGFVERASSNTQYVYNNAISDNTWTFVAIDYSDARGNGARMKIWTGTTPDNLTERTATVVAEGSGTQTDDSGQAIAVGSRFSDDIRCFPGDIGGLVGLVPGNLTIGQLRQFMVGYVPSGVAPAWLSDMSTTVADYAAGDTVARLVGTSAAGTTPSATESTAPTLTGSITVSSITDTTYTIESPVATDNVVVEGYQYRINAGSWTTIAAGARTANITGRTAGATDTVEMRAFDPSGNNSTALSTTVELLSPAATITTDPFKNYAGTLLAGALLENVLVIAVADRSVKLSLSNQTTDASTGRLSLASTDLTPDATYMVLAFNADGTVRGAKRVTAVAA